VTQPDSSKSIFFSVSTIFSRGLGFVELLPQPHNGVFAVSTSLDHLCLDHGPFFFFFLLRSASSSSSN
jgi:hypothetical protein